MLRRSILEVSYRCVVRRIQTQHIPRFLRREFSAAVQKSPAAAASAQPGGPGKPPEKSGGGSNAVLFGGLAVGGGVALAYGAGYLDPILGWKKETEPETVSFIDDKRVEEYVLPPPRVEEDSSKLSPEQSEEKIDAHSENVAKFEGSSESQSQVEDKSVVSDVTAEKDLGEDKSVLGDMASEKDLGDLSHNASVEVSSEVKNLDANNEEEKTSEAPQEEVQAAPLFTKTDHQEDEIKVLAPQQENVEDKAEDAVANAEEPPSSLLSTYNLKGEANGGSNQTHSSDEYSSIHKEKEATIDAVEGLNNAYITKDGKLVLDFLQAIHAAEKRQAELDACVLSEEKRALKEKYEMKLKDAAIMEMMLAEEAAMLEKELKRERTKSVAALKSLKEKLEEKYISELEQKENKKELKLKQVVELAKAELAAAIAREKTSQIEKMTEANLHINALCAAFYARSEEARHSDSAQKLALGALSLEDALSKGLPIQTEMKALHTDLEGIDSVLDLVLSSLPEETRSGTDTLLQLNQKFDALKGTVRQYSLIPPGGGGILTHSLARIASWLKVKEEDQSGDGIESVIYKVESCLADGKLVEAATALEEGVKGTRAEEIVGNWVRRARNRAITEQALTLLQSYATSISVK